MDIEKYKNKDFFKVPEGFFEKHYNEIIEKKGNYNNESSKTFAFSPYLKLTIVAFLIFIIIMFITYHKSDNSEKIDTFEQITELLIYETDDELFYDIYIDVINQEYKNLIIDKIKIQNTANHDSFDIIIDSYIEEDYEF